MCFTAKTVYSGLAIDVDLHLLYFSDEGQGQVGELDLNSTDVKKRIIDAENDARPRSIAIDTVNRCYIQQCSSIRLTLPKIMAPANSIVEFA